MHGWCVGNFGLCCHVELTEVRVAPSAATVFPTQLYLRGCFVYASILKKEAVFFTETLEN